MPKILIIEACIIAGLHREPGETVEITDEDARILYHNPRVALVEDEAPAETAVADESPAEPAADEKPADAKAKK